MERFLQLIHWLLLSLAVLFVIHLLYDVALMSGLCKTSIFATQPMSFKTPILNLLLTQKMEASPDGWWNELLVFHVLLGLLVLIIVFAEGRSFLFWVPVSVLFPYLTILIFFNRDLPEDSDSGEEMSVKSGVLAGTSDDHSAGAGFFIRTYQYDDIQYEHYELPRLWRWPANGFVLSLWLFILPPYFYVTLGKMESWSLLIPTVFWGFVIIFVLVAVSFHARGFFCKELLNRHMPWGRYILQIDDEEGEVVYERHSEDYSTD